MKKVKVKCPYCGAVNYIEHDFLAPFDNKHVINCYSEEEPSCDKYFVVFSEAKIETKSMKIEAA